MKMTGSDNVLAGKGVCVKKVVTFLARLLVVAMIACLLLGIKATAESKRDRREKQETYLQVKPQIVQKAGEVMKAHGFRNSGITLTRRERDDKEEWMLRVHHGSINGLAEEDQQAILKELGEIMASAKQDNEISVAFQ